MKLTISTLCFLLFFCFSSTLKAQNNVEWTFEFDKESSSMVFTAKIGEHWHLYSQETDPSVGPIPTSFSYTKNKSIKVEGEVNEPTPIEHYDVNFEGDVLFFEGMVEFTQKIKVKKDTTVEGTVSYMVCNDEMCLPPVDVPFRIEVSK